MTLHFFSLKRNKVFSVASGVYLPPLRDLCRSYTKSLHQACGEALGKPGPAGSQDEHLWTAWEALAGPAKSCSFLIPQTCTLELLRAREGRATTPTAFGELDPEVKL